MKDTGLDLSLIIACYNEAQHLRESVSEVVHVLDRCRLQAELIFVEDCSSDGTASILDAVVQELATTHPMLPVKVLRHDVNKGRGATVRDGMLAATGRVMGFIDIDLEVHARYIPDFVRAVDNGFDVATGFRVYHVDGNNLIRHFMSVGYRALMRRAISTTLLDTETGYKFFKRQTCQDILARTRTDGWFWDTEMMILCERSGLRITEIPVAFVRRLDKRSTVRVLPDTVDYVKRLVEFRVRLAGDPTLPRRAPQSANLGRMTPPGTQPVSAAPVDPNAIQ